MDLLAKEHNYDYESNSHGPPSVARLLFGREVLTPALGHTGGAKFIGNILHSGFSVRC
jgi:hypothetical protein